MILDEKYIDELKAYLESEEFIETFEYSPEERRYEILDLLEKVMELGEAADATATKLIFKNSALGALYKDKAQK